MILWFNEALLPGGWAANVAVHVEGDRIAAVAPGADPAAADERHAVALPGLANVHSHGFQRGMAGLSAIAAPGGDDFWSWRTVMYRFLDRLDPDDVEAITAFACVEMLEGGFTRLGEFHYLHHAPDGRPYAAPAEMAGRIAAAAQAAGIGLTLLPVFYAHGDFGGRPPGAGQRRFITDVDGFARLVADSRALLAPGDTLGIAPHSLRAATPEELTALLPLMADGPIHIHAAEQLREVEASVAVLGARPVEWLLANMPVDRHWCLVHATHMTDAETAALAASGAVAGFCPLTEADLGDGIAPADTLLGCRGRLAIGTDSNILIDAAGELRQLEYAQRLKRRQRNILATADYPSVGRSLFEAALAGGQRALGHGGGLAAGAPADIVTLAADHPALCGAGGDRWLDGWIFAARAPVIDSVWRAGRKRVAGGRHLARDTIALRYRRALAKMAA